MYPFSHRLPSHAYLDTTFFFLLRMQFSSTYNSLFTLNAQEGLQYPSIKIPPTVVHKHLRKKGTVNFSVRLSFFLLINPLTFKDILIFEHRLKNRIFRTGMKNESCSVVSDSLRVYGVLQASILEWVAFPFFRGSSKPDIKPRCPALQNSLPAEPPGTGMSTRGNSTQLWKSFPDNGCLTLRKKWIRLGYA